ncbi:MAG: amidohydrolase family protein [Nitrospinaceae bacterium]|nr:amidohydrolase family protein [Nitrospinaceae bacterium]MBT3432516.1 amidohydrolase family protein [Nitrospinaceae bacterium]MBT4095192.1 amidohydrolase family protein [Nitrospinaceae bacterium]MBT4429998.1 amidohydrolase family protein [Nitrospinaceae bacterium]MBT5370063.1 amidohydrolase family protein [Nitrospinaceae bacterium]
MIIDPHAHISPESFIDDVRKKRFGKSVTIRKGKPWEFLVTRTKILGKERVHVNPLPKETYDVSLRLKGMKKQNVDMQILSVVPPMTYYALDKGLNKELSASLNESLLKIVDENPDKFRCMAQIPLQDPKAAAKELERAVKKGHLGCQIGSNVAGTNLDDKKLDPVWRMAQKLDVPIFIHPTDVMGVNDRLKDYYLRNFIGNPLDTTIAAACLIFGGVFDRFPKVKFLLSHVGGFTPWIRGRWQHGYGERQEPKVNKAKAPENYFKKFYYDTIIHNADSFEFAVKSLGVNRILYGTDYPFDMGNLSRAEKIPGLSRFSKKDQQKMLVGNVKKLYKLKV